MQVPARDRIHAVTVTLNGRREFTRRADAPLLSMVSREDFDDALRKAAADAGVTMRQRATVRGIGEDGGLAWARLADGTSVRARVLVGADARRESPPGTWGSGSSKSISGWNWRSRCRRRSRRGGGSG